MSKNYNVDLSELFKMIDDRLVNLDLDVLLKARKELIEENKDTAILDRAIEEKRRRLGMDKKEEKKKNNGLFDLIFGKEKEKNDMMPWEKDAIEKEGYEEYNFEEEELEEDDYYFDDDK